MTIKFLFPPYKLVPIEETSLFSTSQPHAGSGEEFWGRVSARRMPAARSPDTPDGPLSCSEGYGCVNKASEASRVHVPGHDLFHLHRGNVRVHRVSETAEFRTPNEPGPGRQRGTARRDVSREEDSSSRVKPAAGAGGTGTRKLGTWTTAGTHVRAPRGVWVNSVTRFLEAAQAKDRVRSSLGAQTEGISQNPPGPGPGSPAVADWLETYNLDALKETIHV